MNFIPRTLTWKIALVVLAVSLLSVGLVALFSGWVTAREYDQLIMERLKTNFAAQAASWYEAQGSWEGFSDASMQAAMQDPGRRPNRRDFFRQDGPEPVFVWPFVLVDADRCVVGPPSDQYPVGECLPFRAIAGGTAVEVNDERVGTVIATGNVIIRDPSEELFLNRTTRGLVWGAIGAGIIALLLGIALASTLTRPLRRLTAAIHAMAQGDLEQRVDVQSRDEIGELADAFNGMSAQLVQSNQARRQMTADIAHELRNPLMVMTGYIEALREGVLQGTPKRYDMMYEEAQHLQRLVADLRTLSLADAGELPLTRQRTTAAALLERTVEAYGPAATKKDVRLTFAVEGAPLEVNVDVERMAQVLANLVTNALRHTPAGGEVRLLARPDRQGALITVADTGEGIAPDVLPRVFDRLYRADGARSQNGDESGLGLAIVKSIITAHGGTISVVSEVGAGTRFMIWLAGE